MNKALKSEVAIFTLPSGEAVLLDHEDFDRVSQFSWSLSRSGANCYAVHSRAATRSRPPLTLLMHRLILGLGRADRWVVVDHINGNGLDNRKANLRVCTQQENLRNQRKRRHSRSRFKGVSPVAFSKTGKWAAKLWINGHLMHLGTFATEEEAARAYDEAIQVHHGEFARLNFPEASGASGGAR